MGNVDHVLKNRCLQGQPIRLGIDPLFPLVRRELEWREQNLPTPQKR